MPPPELTTRPATLDDEAVLTALAARLGECPLPRWRTPEEIAGADLRAMLLAIRSGQADNEVFIAERDGAAVGCLHILAGTDFFGRAHAHLSVLSVTREAEGTGVADFLMGAAEDWTRARGLSLLTLNVLPGNARARRVYERSGFEPDVVGYTKPL